MKAKITPQRKKRMQHKERNQLIPLLQDIQNKYGFIPKKSVADLGDSMNIPTTKIHGLITFYNQFRYQPPGHYHIRICRGTSCHMNHSKKLLDTIEQQLNLRDGDVSTDGLFSLEIVPCLGACGQGPVIGVNDEYYTQVNTDKLEEIIEYYQNVNESHGS
ncbi:MAG: NAD(P)H-dependent oxidoreductase subunit E [Bacteroidales bacterium]